MNPAPFQGGVGGGSGSKSLPPHPTLSPQHVFSDFRHALRSC